MSTTKGLDPNKIPDGVPQTLKENQNFLYYMQHQKDWIDQGLEGLPVIVSNNMHYILGADFTAEEQVEYLEQRKKILQDDPTAYDGLIGFPLGVQRRRQQFI